MLLVGIATYIVVCGVGFTLRELKDFLLLAVLVGTAQGGVQALSRSFFGKLIPAGTGLPEVEQRLEAQDPRAAEFAAPEEEADEELVV